MARSRKTNEANTDTLPATGQGVGGVALQVQAVRDSKRTQNWAAYVDLLHDVAMGNKVDPVELELTLEMVGRSTEELAADAEKFAKRLERWEVVKHTAQHERDLSQAESELATAIRERDIAFERLEAVRLEKLERVRELERAIERCRFEEAYLRHTFDDPVALERESRLQAELAGMRPELDRAESRIAELREELRRATEGGAQRYYITGIQSQIDNWQATIEDRQPRVDAIRRELEQINQAKAKP